MNIQTFLVMGSIIALTFTILTMNRSQSYQSTLELNNEGIITATGIGQSLLEEIQLKSFDEKTISKVVTDVDSLTSYLSLKPESGENSQYLYDDIDDYNGYEHVDSLQRLGVFTTLVNVYYVETMNPDEKVNNRTFSKRIDISISNEYLLDAVVFSKVISY